MQNIINEQLIEMLNKLDETGEFSRYRLEKLSEDPEALFKACLEWEGIICYDEEIKQYAKGLFKALPELLYDEEDENPFEELEKKQEEIHFLCSLLNEEQLDKFNKFLKEKENHRGYSMETEKDLTPVEG